MKLRQTIRTALYNAPILGPSFQLGIQARANSRFPKRFAGTSAKILEAVMRDGYHVLPSYFPSELCDACVTHLKHIASHYPQYTKTREDIRIFGAENMGDASMAFYRDSHLQSLSDAYYGEPSHIGTMLANWVEPERGNTLGSGGDWHRDSLLRQFKALVYLSDVNEENGPFQIIAGSNTHHRARFKEDMRRMGAGYSENRYTHAMVAPLLDASPERLVTFTASKGTVILVDTSAIHRGAPLQSGERFAMFNYYYPIRGFDTRLYQRKFSPRLPADYAR